MEAEKKEEQKGTNWDKFSETRTPQATEEHVEENNKGTKEPIEKETPVKEVEKTKEAEIKEKPEDKSTGFWDYAKEKLGDDFEMLKKEGFNDLSDNEKNDRLFNALKGEDKSRPKAESDDDFINDYLKAKEDENFSKDKWLESKYKKQNILSLDNKEFMKEMMKQRTDMSDEDIQSDVDKMDKAGTLNFTANAQKKYYEKEQMESKNKIDTEALKKHNTKVSEQVSKLIETKKDKEKIWGLDVDKVHKKEFDERFSKLFEIGESGQRPIDKILSNDELLYDMLFVADGNGNIVRSAINDLKENPKQKLEEKLGLQEKEENRRQETNETKPPNWDKFGEAEG